MYPICSSLFQNIFFVNKVSKYYTFSLVDIHHWRLNANWRHFTYVCIELLRPRSDNAASPHVRKTDVCTGPKRQQYRCPYALREEMRSQIDEMKERGVITEAISDWLAPVIFVTNFAD
jgi:hypothetical protein